MKQKDKKIEEIKSKKRPIKEKQPGEINEKKLAELFKITQKGKINPGRLWIVGKNNHFRICQGDHDFSIYKEDYSAIKPNSFSRGEILDSFSKIEFFVNELIQGAIFGYTNDAKANAVDYLLDGLDFYRKLKILSGTFGIIDKNSKLYSKILLVKQVRDNLAHLWNIDYVYYKNPEKGLLKDNFEEFQNDLKFIWKELIGVYETKVDQDKLIEDTINKINAILNLKPKKIF